MSNKPAKNDLSKFANVKAPGVLTKAPKEQGALKEKVVTQPKRKKSPPWESDDIIKGRKVQVMFRMDEEIHAMLKFIKERTGASANHTVISNSTPEIKKLAAKLWSQE